MFGSESERMNGDSGKEPESELARVVERNINALIQRRRTGEARRRFQDRLADAITRFSGSMAFVYVHLAIVLLWVAINVGWVPGVRPFDPTFVILATVASVEAIFLSTFVLISQNRMARMADQRADLDVQISLLAEHEITRLVTLVSAMAEKMDIAQAKDPELSELKQDVAPEKVMERIEREEGTS